MKIARKQSSIVTETGLRIQQGPWQPLTQELIQSEFQVQYPSRSSLKPAFGALAIFMNPTVTKLRFMFSPEDLMLNPRPYEALGIDTIELSGQLLGAGYGFTHRSKMRPSFDDAGGWTFLFDKITSTVLKHAHTATAEAIVADLICTEQFKVTISYQDRELTVLFGQVVLGDTEGLRQTLCDIAGRPYVERLLRSKGFDPV